MLRKRTTGWLLASLIFLGSGLGAPDALAQEQAWDQERVTTLARELADAAREVRRATRAEPGAGDPAQMNARAFTQYLEILQQIERATGRLARQLEEGQGHDPTLATARRIDMLLRDASVQARRLDIPKPTQDKIDPALAAIAQLRPFYTPAPAEGEAAAGAHEDGAE